GSAPGIGSDHRADIEVEGRFHLLRVAIAATPLPLAIRNAASHYVGQEIADPEPLSGRTLVDAVRLGDLRTGRQVCARRAGARIPDQRGYQGERDAGPRVSGEPLPDPGSGLFTDLFAQHRPRLSVLG